MLIRKNFFATYGPWIALTFLFTFCMLVNEEFRQPLNLVNIFRQNSYTGIVAIGMTFIIIGGGIDLSVGSLFALSAGLGVMAINSCQGSTGLAVCIGLAVSAGVGLLGGMLNGALVTVGKLPPFIATLGTMSIYRSLILYLSNAGSINCNNAAFTSFDSHKFCYLNTSTWCFLILIVLGALLLRQTTYGRHLMAIGENERVARYAAIPVQLLRFASYAAAGLLCGAAGILQASRLSSVSSSSSGSGLELEAIAIAIIGGTSMAGGKGSVWGVLAGALILGIIGNIMVMWDIAPNLQGIIKGTIIIAAVLLQLGKFNFLKR